MDYIIESDNVFVSIKVGNKIHSVNSPEAINRVLPLLAKHLRVTHQDAMQVIQKAILQDGFYQGCDSLMKLQEHLAE
ncbi:hypothetical protein Q5H80_03080 [Vibrio sp. SNU_ST1]|uniref:hypothetical protein n=1 Tax=Vibrio sp. SNU_ST1 TaxID=3064001 RepID=UPI00272B47B1|nr:hypothetical protein [Vibrio sp. SNU_ST1]WKY58649.1 hypothetical protein Q5H80_03080 [Vibrio sp. SNU_ST1]